MIVDLLAASALVAALPKDCSSVEQRRNPSGELLVARPWDCGGGADSAILVPVAVKGDTLEPMNGSTVVHLNPTVTTDDWVCLDVQASPDTRVLLFLHRAPSCERGFKARVPEATVLRAPQRKCDPPLRFKENPSQEEIEAAERSVRALPSNSSCLIRGTSAEAK